MLLSACSEQSPGRSAALYSDSAGVTLVPNAELSGRTWTLGQEPELVIGRDSDRPGHALSRVTSATRLESGAVVIADAGTTEVGVFAPRGELLSIVARTGGGPGEFDSRRPFEVLPSSDTIFVFGMSSGRDKIAGFSDDGRLLVEHLQSEAVSRRGAWYGSTASRTGEVFGLQERLPRNEPESRSVARRPAHLVRYAFAATEMDTIAEYPGTSYFYADVGPRAAIGGGTVSGPRPITPVLSAKATIAGGGDPYRVLVGDQGAPSLDVYDASGALLQRTRWVGGDRRPTTPDFESIRTELTETYGRTDPVAAERVWSVMPLSSTTPVFRGLHVGRANHFWVERYPLPTDAGAVWWVFAPSGEFVGSVEIPDARTLLEAGNDYLLLRGVDDLGVQRVEQWSLSRGG